MTATPKETKYTSNIEYFGPPVYTYSLKQGIQDGFLAPYKVINVHVDVDVDGYRPEKGKTDRDGEEVPDRIYNQKDFDRAIVIDDRTKLVAKRVTEYLKESGDQFQKRSSSVSTKSTRRGCGRRSSTRTEISPPPTAGTSCGSPQTTATARISSATSSTRSQRTPSSSRHRGSSRPGSMRRHAGS